MCTAFSISGGGIYDIAQWMPMANRGHTIPEFGDRLANVDYVERPGAYAIIHDGEGSIAVVETASGLHLPGGGLGDSEADHIVRWLEVSLAREALLHESHRWALNRWYTIAFPERGSSPVG